MRTPVPGACVGSLVEPPAQLLRKLTIRDDALLQRVLAKEESGHPVESSLDPKTHALVCIAALIAMDAAAPSYLCAVERARAAGASDEEIVGCLLAVVRFLGEPRVVSAAPKLGLALGYDVGAALEEAGSALG
jgi:alkylhydroperoxidase/carboxymuconolactone decarboxylase family protein YurZ